MKKKKKIKHELEGKSDECIFCKIVKGGMDAAIFWENKKYLAMLDLYPNCKGMTLIVSKSHGNSDVFAMKNKEYYELFDVARKIAKKLEKAFDVKRVAIVCEGMGIDHMHIKLYPLHGIKSKIVKSWADKDIYFKKYEGYVTTLLGPKAKMKELKELVKVIKRKTKNA